MVKVAVCLSGAIRSFNQTYQSLFDNIISGCNADVFMHCWVKSRRLNKHNQNYIDN